MLIVQVFNYVGCLGIVFALVKQKGQTVRLELGNLMMTMVVPVILKQSSISGFFLLAYFKEMEVKIFQRVCIPNETAFRCSRIFNTCCRTQDT